MTRKVTGLALSMLLAVLASVPLCHNFARTICIDVFESVKSTG